VDRLVRYFTEGIQDQPIATTVGMEIETSFIDLGGQPITLAQSQQLLVLLCNGYGWFPGKVKNQLLTEIFDRNGNKILYELGRQNIELSAAPGRAVDVVEKSERILQVLYSAAAEVGAFPNLEPILKTDESLLVIPDERDAIWLELDGREALELLARISSVQFTVSVPLAQAVVCLNRLGENIGRFLKYYPQEEYWRKYIRESKAGYNPMRYGGPLFFHSIENYCERLVGHDVILGPAQETTPLFRADPARLVSYGKVVDLDIPLYLRSIWWYFRLRRYGNTLGIEVRPLPRDNEPFQEKLDFVLGILGVSDAGPSSIRRTPFFFEEGGACGILPEPD